MNDQTTQDLLNIAQEIINNECDHSKIDQLTLNQKWELIVAINSKLQLQNENFNYLVNTYINEQNNFETTKTTNTAQPELIETVIVEKQVYKKKIIGGKYRYSATILSFCLLIFNVINLIILNFDSAIIDQYIKQDFIYQVAIALNTLSSIVSICLLFIYDQKSRLIANITLIFLMISIILSGLIIVIPFGLINFIASIIIAFLVVIAFTINPNKVKINE